MSLSVGRDWIGGATDSAMGEGGETTVWPAGPFSRSREESDIIEEVERWL